MREARLRSADTTKERQQLTRQREKLEALRKHLEALDRVVGTPALTELKRSRGALDALEEAAALLARSFESEPRPGVGSSPWKELWEAARRYSTEHAYPDVEFPFLDEESQCVLCQQPLEADARARFARFDEFVRNDIQVRLNEARRVHDEQARRLRELDVSPEAVTSNLTDLETTHREVVMECRRLLSSFESLRGQACEGLAEAGDLPQLGISWEPFATRLTEATEEAKRAVEDLASPEGVQQQISALVEKRMSLELLETLKKSRPTIVGEIDRLKRRATLEAAKSAAATTGITKKILELSEESVTEVVRDTFTRETERLRLERVTIARTRAEKGALLHRPKLVGARQQATLPRVFSEGERTALGLAAFFTEASLDASKSALVLDDPVSSLDHIRRGLVATRLAALAEQRQIVVFTHDVAFVADLKREASAMGVAVAERSVARSRADERKPGACSKKHPWKAKDVAARLDELGQDLARIKKQSGGWDDNAYEEAIATWAGKLSETWERIFSQEIVGPVLAEGGLEVRPMMVKVLARFSENDQCEFDASYSRVSLWAKRHDKSAKVNYVAPEVRALKDELTLVEGWFKRVKGYKA